MTGGTSNGLSRASWGVFDNTPTMRADGPAVGPTQFQASGIGARDQSSGTSATPTNNRDLGYVTDGPNPILGGISAACVNVADHLDPVLPNRELDSIGEISYGTPDSRETAFPGSQDDLRVFIAHPIHLL